MSLAIRSLDAASPNKLMSLRNHTLPCLKIKKGVQIAWVI